MIIVLIYNKTYVLNIYYNNQQKLKLKIKSKYF